MPLTFVHISDLHFGQEDGHALDLTKQQIERLKPDAVIVSGDITALGSKREMRQAFAWLRVLPAPVLVTPGNHDTPYFDLLPRLFDPFGGFRRASEGCLINAWTDERFVIVPINTARGIQWRKNWALGEISAGQAKHACQILSNAPHGAAKIVVTHHPLIWPGRAPIPGDTRGGVQGAQILMKGGAELFLSGHLHQSSVEERSFARQAALFANAGTLSIRQRGEPASFLVIRRDDVGAWTFEHMRVHENGALLPERAEIHEMELA